MMMMCNDVMWT